MTLIYFMILDDKYDDALPYSPTKIEFLLL